MKWRVILAEGKRSKRSRLDLLYRVFLADLELRIQELDLWGHDLELKAAAL
jgi:hypothetical protein